jgi:ABC-type polysaccharide/polyol phosphate transport system ATPase subunit
MEPDAIIQIDGLSKVYPLYGRPFDRLKEALHPFGRSCHRDFYALRNVTFDVRAGETLGIIGRNGSGKSTLLKILAGVLTPTQGQARVVGRVASLLELGAGFNPELSGLENVYLQGALMGLTRRDMQPRLPDILSFAEIGDFITQPVKHYSSGMFVRLAFACAVHVSADVLIVDEALAVGDIFFQNRCFHRLRALQAEGVTLLFVSHDIGLVKQLCAKALWLDSGAVRQYGDSERVCRSYFNTVLEQTRMRDAPVPAVPAAAGDTPAADAPRRTLPRLPAAGPDDFTTAAVDILSFFMAGPDGAPTCSLTAGCDYTCHLVGRLHEPLDRLIFGFTLENAQGLTLLACNSFRSESDGIAGAGGELIETVFMFRLPLLRRGDYLLSPAIARGTQEQHAMLSWRHHVLAVHVENPGANLAVLDLGHEDVTRRLREDRICWT